MISFDETAKILDEIALGLPPEFYRQLNGGINLLQDVKVHPAGGDDLLVLGDYHSEPRGLGRYINIYYGSFVRVYAQCGRERQRDELRRVLLHEFTHHLESLGGERGLEIKDAEFLEDYRRRNAGT